jgi:hypothetical protein
MLCQFPSVFAHELFVPDGPMSTTLPLLSGPSRLSERGKLAVIPPYLVLKRRRFAGRVEAIVPALDRRD